MLNQLKFWNTDRRMLRRDWTNAGTDNTAGKLQRLAAGPWGLDLSTRFLQHEKHADISIALLHRSDAFAIIKTLFEAFPHPVSTRDLVMAVFGREKGRGRSDNLQLREQRLNRIIKNLSAEICRTWDLAYTPIGEIAGFGYRLDGFLPDLAQTARRGRPNRILPLRTAPAQPGANIQPSAATTALQLRDLVNRPELRQKAYAAGEYVFSSEDAAAHLYYIVSGYVIMEHWNIHGTLTINDIAGPDEFISPEVLVGRRLYPCFARVISDCQIRAVPVSEITQEQNLGLLAQEIMHLLGEKIEDRDAISRIRTLNANQSVASLFVHLAERYGQMQSGHVTLPRFITQKDLALLCNGSRESVSGVLNDLYQRGLVEPVRTGKRRPDGFVIPDLENLRDYSELQKPDAESGPKVKIAAPAT